MDIDGKHIDINNWPFSVPPNTGCITTKQVMLENYPVLSILHDKDGAWQVLCSTTENADDGMLVGLGSLYEKFPFMDKFVNIPLGHEATRESESAEWEIFETHYGEN